MPAKPFEYSLVSDSANLDEVARRLANAPLVAIDTEFVRESTYFPELCVLQIATDDFVAAIDCLTDADLNPLFDALLANDRQWVLHSARQDLEVLGQRFGRLPTQLIDTQIAAAMLGFPLQIGLQGLLLEVLGIAIDKEHTRADWSRRPLPEAVIQYALDDVRYLLPAWRELSARLENSGRVDWFHEDCRRQVELPIQPDATTILERTKGVGPLRGKQRAAALALVAWREDRAIQRNKPRRWILTDDQLAAIAAALPQTADDLRRVPGLPPNLVARSGAALLASLRDAPPAPAVSDSPAPDKAVVKALQTEVKALADGLKVQPELLATRKDIALAASGRPPEAFTNGWRSAVLAPLAARLSASRGS
jgi:ribonuclease D